MNVKLDLFFAALADRTRLRLLNLMRGGDVCVCFFVEILDAPQPKISRHLAFLRRAGLVHARRDGKWMHYSIVRPADAVTRRILDDTLRALATDPELQRDLEKLSKVCCSPRAPGPLKRAPKPGAVHSMHP
jgi:ArsR family transcriptional regulator